MLCPSRHKVWFCLCGTNKIKCPFHCFIIFILMILKYHKTIHNNYFCLWIFSPGMHGISLVLCWGITIDDAQETMRDDIDETMVASFKASVIYTIMCLSPAHKAEHIYRYHFIFILKYAMRLYLLLNNKILPLSSIFPFWLYYLNLIQLL